MIDFVELANTGVQQLHPYQAGKSIGELQRELGVENIIKLASNENPLGASPLAIEAAQKALHEPARYPDPAGYELKQALAEYLTIEADHITLGNGSDSLFTLLLNAFGGPGKNIVISEYGFAGYAIAAKTTQTDVITAPAKDWGCDLTAMANAITPETSLVFMANPNNPTGTWVNENELITFLEQIPERVIVVMDEAYFEFMQQSDYPDTIKLQSQYPQLVTTRTFSKAYGLAGLRVGYAIANPSITEILNRIRLPFNVSSPAQAAAVAALKDQAHIERSIQSNEQNKQFLMPAFTDLGFNHLPVTSNFITVDLGVDATPVYQDLLKQGIIVRPIANFGMPNHLRISIGLDTENQRLLKAFSRIFS